MANTITKTTVQDGPRNTIILVNISGDNSGDETEAVLFDRSAFAPTDGTKVAVHRVEGLLGGFRATLSFNATADLPFVHLPDGDAFEFDWRCEGGVPSSIAGAGANGDIVMATTGLASETGTFLLHLVKS